MERDMSIDWIKKVKEEFPEEYKNLNIVYLPAISKEGKETIELSLKSIAESDFGASKISVVFALEGRFSDIQIPVFQQLKAEYGSKFKEMICFVHPADIPGEIVGVKGANINWATREYVKYLTKKGEDISKYLIAPVDSDWRPHKKFFSAIAHKYFSSENRDHKYYVSAIHTYNNNIWKVPPLVRMHSMTTPMAILHNWVVARRTQETFSAYVVNLKTVHETEYWAPDIQNDDTAFYWNALIRYNGDFSGQEVYIPTYNDAVENENRLKTHTSLYKQQHRWGWGIIVFPITLAALFENKRIPLLKKLDIISILFENRLVYVTVIYMLTLALPLLNILSPKYVFSSASYNLPKLLSYIMTSLMFINLPVIYLRRKIAPIPKGWSVWRHIWDYCETFLIAINMLSFGFLPYIQAHTELMIGKNARKVLYITDKVAIKKND
jgi:hypothetical protein